MKTLKKIQLTKTYQRESISHRIKSNRPSTKENIIIFYFFTIDKNSLVEQHWMQNKYEFFLDDVRIVYTSQDRNVYFWTR